MKREAPRVAMIRRRRVANYLGLERNVVAVSAAAFLRGAAVEKIPDKFAQVVKLLSQIDVRATNFRRRLRAERFGESVVV